MSDDLIKVEIKGLEELQAAIAKFPKQSAIYLGYAGNEAAKKVILATEGLQKYPPATEANSPPAPYYKRGMGMVYKNGVRATSENLGKQWTVKREGFNTEIGNRASYAKWVHGDDTQATFMAPKGWRKLREVTEEKMTAVIKVYQTWVDKLLKDVGLK